MRSNLLQNVERMWSRGGPPSCFATPLLRTGWRLDCHAGGVKRRTPGEALAVVPRCVTDCRLTKTFQLVLADELVERLDFEGEEIARIRAVAERERRGGVFVRAGLRPRALLRWRPLIALG